MHPNVAPRYPLLLSPSIPSAFLPLQTVLDAPPKGIELDELRGIALYPSSSDRAGQLVVANAHKSDSAVLRYSANASKTAGHRDFIDEMLVRNKEDPALLHPYSIIMATLNFHLTPRRVFVSSQDSSSVLAYDADTGAAMPVASHWQTTFPHATFDPGTLVPSMAAVGYAGGGLSGPRSMAIGLQRDQLFVVDSEGDCVRGYDILTGNFLGDVWCGTDSANRDKGKYPIGLVLLHDSRRAALPYLPVTILPRTNPCISTLVLTLEADGTLIAVDVSQWPGQNASSPVTLLTGMHHALPSLCYCNIITTPFPLCVIVTL